MKESKYDDELFFEKYSRFPRSVDGLHAAGEWSELKKMLPDLNGKRFLDLGCGFGWHCLYAYKNNAQSITGLDISKRMLEVAAIKSKGTSINYICSSIEGYDYPYENFDVVLSSLAFHYIDSFEAVCKKVNQCLTLGGNFIFSLEHPIFTAEGKQQWILDENGNPLHWAVDNYFFEGSRNASFLGEQVIKYHRTLTTYFRALLNNGFAISDICEPTPTSEMLQNLPDMKQELRRPMMLIMSAKKLFDFYSNTTSLYYAVLFYLRAIVPFENKFPTDNGLYKLMSTRLGESII